MKRGDKFRCKYCRREVTALRRTQVTCGGTDCLRAYQLEYSREARRVPIAADNKLRELAERAKAKKPLFN